MFQNGTTFENFRKYLSSKRVEVKNEDILCWKQQNCPFWKPVHKEIFEPSFSVNDTISVWENSLRNRNSDDILCHPLVKKENIWCYMKITKLLKADTDVKVLYCPNFRDFLKDIS